MVIKADSEYLVKGMTSWIYKWRDNGYEDCRGLSLTNADLFRRLDQAVDDLNGMNVGVQFWHVGRSSNRIADCLANAALDGVGVEDALDQYSDGSS